MHAQHTAIDKRHDTLGVSHTAATHAFRDSTAAAPSSFTQRRQRYRHHRRHPSISQTIQKEFG
jgi:hypothetical protein